MEEEEAVTEDMGVVTIMAEEEMIVETLTVAEEMGATEGMIVETTTVEEEMVETEVVATEEMEAKDQKMQLLERR